MVSVKTFSQDTKPAQCLSTKTKIQENTDKQRNMLSLDWTHLPLSKWNRVEFVTTKSFVFGKLQQGHSGVSPWRQYKDQWSSAVWISIGFCQVKWRWLYKLLAEFTRYKHCDCSIHLEMKYIFVQQPVIIIICKVF